MPGLERDPNFAVRLESADARAMPGTRIDDNERPASRVNLNPFGRHDPGKDIIDRPLERAPVENKLDFIFEHVGDGLGQVLTVLIAALTHEVPEQDAALRCVD